MARVKVAGDVVNVDDDVDDGANHLGHSTQDTSVGNSQAKELKLQVELLSQTE